MNILFLSDEELNFLRSLVGDRLTVREDVYAAPCDRLDVHYVGQCWPCEIQFHTNTTSDRLICPHCGRPITR